MLRRAFKKGKGYLKEQAARRGFEAAWRLLHSTKAAIRDLEASSFDRKSYVGCLNQMAERASLIIKQQAEDEVTIKGSHLLDIAYSAPISFHGTEVVYIKSFVRQSTRYGGLRCPFPGFHPGIYRNAHPDLNEPPFVNPFAHFIRRGRPKGPWLLDIIRPDSASPADGRNQRVALHLHIYYADLASELFKSVAANRIRPDVFVTVSSEKGLNQIADKAAELGITMKEIVIVPNKGRDIGPFLTLLGPRLMRDYDVVGHLHAKGSPHVPDQLRNRNEMNFGMAWRSFCLENLLGGKRSMMDTILDHFAGNSTLGLVFPCDPWILGWTRNRGHADVLLERMGIVTELPEAFFFPVGTMFWARADAIAPLIEAGFDWNDYPAEPVPLDGTILHAIERLLPVVAQHRGFQIAGTHVPGYTR